MSASPTPTRILIVSAGLLHEGRDPRTIRAERLIAGLGRRGFEIDLLGLWLGEGDPPEVPGVRRLHAIRAPIDWGSAGGEPGGAEGLAEWVERSGTALAGTPGPERPDLVYAIGLPTSALAAGASIARPLELPLILDLGDPWPAANEAERAGRARVLGAAAALVTTTPELAAAFAPDLPVGAPTLLAPGGGVIGERRPRAPGAPPLFVHLGAINAGRVDPQPAFAALARLHDAGRIELRSHTTGWHPELDRLPHPHLPLLPHAEALELLAEASAALVLGNDNREQLPSKAYEIACTECWALSVSELEGDATIDLLQRSGHAVVAERNEAGHIAVAAEEILAREARGERPTPAPEHSWERRIDEIAELIGCALGR